MGNISAFCAGVVTYNPDIDVLIKNLQALSPQVRDVFVVDNGSNNINDIEDLLGHFNNITIFLNPQNLGIAQALNKLCKIASSRRYDWILTMDQDSMCDGNMVANLSNYANEEYGIIAPRVEFRKDGVLIEKTGSGAKCQTEQIYACITSGSLTNLIAWKEVGGFDEWYFIDHVDNEFCTHIIQKGYKVLRVNDALLYQRAGDMKYVKLFGKPILLPYYSTFRNYYICRNTIYYMRKYWRDISLYREIRSFIYSQSIKLLFEKGRLKNLKSSIVGMYDGFRKQIDEVDYSA